MARIQATVPLKVIHVNDKIETINVCYPAFLGKGKVLNKMFCSDGTEYFFTKEGYYDGWGKNLGAAEDAYAEVVSEHDRPSP